MRLEGWSGRWASTSTSQACPYAVQADRVSPRAASGAILNDVTSFAGCKNAQPKAGKLFIPNDVV